MPFSVREQGCRMSDGLRGTFSVVNTDTGETVSCHTTKRNAELSARIRQQESDD